MRQMRTFEVQTGRTNRFAPRGNHRGFDQLGFDQSGCTPIAHLKNLSKATANNVEVELTAGGKKHLATFENLRPGQTGDVDLDGLVTRDQTCATFPADVKVAGSPHCLLGGKRFSADTCMAGLKTEASMPSAVALAK